MNKTHIPILVIIIFTIQFGIVNLSAQELIKEIAPFTKIIVGPKIDLVILDGAEYKLQAEFKNILSEKLNIQVKNNKLELYLDDARIVEKNKKIKDENGKRKIGIYDKDVLVKVVITCRQLESIVVRGEQLVDCRKNIDSQVFKLKAYGEPNIKIKSLKVNKLITKLYGESQILVENGYVKTQKLISYGESKVLFNKVENQSSKLRSLGENEFQVSGNNTIRIFSIGESDFFYGENAVIRKRFVLGENTIAHLD